MYCSSLDCDSCNPENQCEQCGSWYRGWCLDCEEFENSLNDEFPFDLTAIQASIESGVITIPKGLDHEERIEFIREKLKELDNE